MNSIDHPITNTDFLAELAQAAPDEAILWVNKFNGNPNGDDAKWGGVSYTPADHQREMCDSWGGQNTYFSVAALFPTPDDNIVRRRKSNFARMLALVVDDVDLDSLYASPSWVIETSPGKTQAGYFLDEDDPDCADEGLCSAVVKSMTMKGFIGGDISGNNAVRYVRLPVGTNQKPRDTGPFKHRLTHWNPSVRLTLEDACGAVGMDLDSVRNAATVTGSNLPTLSSITGSQDEKLAAATKAVLQGNFHDPLNIISASLISTGSHPASVTNMLRGLMEAYPGAHDERWENRYKDIPRCVRGAEEKFAPTRESMKSEFHEVSIADVLSNPEPPHPFLWGPYIPMGALTLLSGHGGSGKSLWSMQLSIAAALGSEFLGYPTIQVNTLFFSAEDGRSQLRIRAANICRSLGLDPSFLNGQLYMLDATEAAMLWEGKGSNQPGAPTENMHALRQYVEQRDIQFLVVDNASDTFAGNRFDKSEVTRYIRALTNLVRERGGSVLMLAHVNRVTVTKHEPSESYSDSVAWHNASRSRLFLEGQLDLPRVLKHEKSNYGPLGEEIHLQMIEGVFQLSDDHDGGRTDPAKELTDSLLMKDLLRSVDEFNQRDDWISPEPNAHANNAWGMLSEESCTPKKMNRKQMLAMFRRMEQLKYLKKAKYQKKNRHTGERWEVTRLGREFAGLDDFASAASACASDEDVFVDAVTQSAAEPAAGAAPAPLGGVGERARAMDEGDLDQVESDGVLGKAVGPATLAQEFDDGGSSNA